MNKITNKMIGWKQKLIGIYAKMSERYTNELKIMSYPIFLCATRKFLFDNTFHFHFGNKAEKLLLNGILRSCDFVPCHVDPI